jgi:hypothetical protein
MSSMEVIVVISYLVKKKLTKQRCGTAAECVQQAFQSLEQG